MRKSQLNKRLTPASLLAGMVIALALACGQDEPDLDGSPDSGDGLADSSAQEMQLYERSNGMRVYRQAESPGTQDMHIYRGGVVVEGQSTQASEPASADQGIEVQRLWVVPGMDSAAQRSESAISLGNELRLGTSARKPARQSKTAPKSLPEVRKGVATESTNAEQITPDDLTSYDKLVRKAEKPSESPPPRKKGERREDPIADSYRQTTVGPGVGSYGGLGSGSEPR